MNITLRSFFLSAGFGISQESIPPESLSLSFFFGGASRCLFVALRLQPLLLYSSETLQSVGVDCLGFASFTGICDVGFRVSAYCFELHPHRSLRTIRGFLDSAS